MTTIKSTMEDMDGMILSVSTYLAVHLTDFRNGSAGMGIAQTMMRRVIGELGYAALALASLTETVFRAALSLLLPIARLCCNEAFGQLFSAITLGGTIISAENTLISIAALVQNIYTQEIDYDQIIPCITLLNNQIFQ